MRLKGLVKKIYIYHLIVCFYISRHCQWAVGGKQYVGGKWYATNASSFEGLLSLPSKIENTSRELNK